MTQITNEQRRLLNEIALRAQNVAASLYRDARKYQTTAWQNAASATARRARIAMGVEDDE